MNVRTAKKPDQRVEMGYISQFNLQSYGNDNLYPQNIMAITSASGTAELCLNRYAKFIEGFGFRNVEFSEQRVNRDGETADTILHNVAGDIARFGGFAIHESSASSIDITYQDLAGDTAFICQFLDNDKTVISTTHF